MNTLAKSVMLSALAAMAMAATSLPVKADFAVGCVCIVLGAEDAHYDATEECILVASGAGTSLPRLRTPRVGDPRDYFFLIKEDPRFLYCNTYVNGIPACVFEEDRAEPYVCVISGPLPPKE